MRQSQHRLTALSIARAKTAGYLGDGGGLYLQITATNARSWIFRFQLDGRRREMGLGPFPEISLAAARNLAQDARALVRAGTDPIAARDAQRASRRLANARAVTWDQAVAMFLAAHEGTWRNAKHRQQWRNTLATYARPVIGTLSVAAIDTPEVTKILDPIWSQFPETAGRVRGRIERVLDWAKVRGLRTGENPARWRGHLDQVFPARAKVRKVRHYPAVPLDAMPAVYQRLREADGIIAALACRFTILTAARAGMVTGARWAEIDRTAAMWTVPGSRMKSGRVHRVPLSREALAVLDTMAELRTGDLIFPGQRHGRPLSGVALAKALRSAGAGKATTHGCRSTFKDWASERTTFADEVSEGLLAHASSDRTRAAYARSELLKKRAAMMEQWARFLSTATAGKVVVPIGRWRTA